LVKKKEEEEEEEEEEIFMGRGLPIRCLKSLMLLFQKYFGYVDRSSLSMRCDKTM
jgi:hypothetical protein